MKKTASVFSNLFTCCYRKSRPASPEDRPPPNPTESSIKWGELPEKRREILSGLFEVRLEEIKDLIFRETREKPAGRLQNPFQFIYRKLHGILEQKIPEREKEDFLKFVRVMSFPSKKKENWEVFLKKTTELTDQFNREKNFPHFKITLVEKSNTLKKSKRPGDSIDIEKSLDLVITHRNFFSRLFRKNEAEKELFKHLRPFTENIRIEACLNFWKGLCEFTIPYDFLAQDDLDTLESAGKAAYPSSIVKVAQQITRNNLGHYLFIVKGENTKTAFLLQRGFGNSRKIAPDRHAAVQKKKCTRRISLKYFRTIFDYKNLELLALPNTFKRSEAHPLKLFLRFPKEDDPETLEGIIANFQTVDGRLTAAISDSSKEPEREKQSHEEWITTQLADYFNMSTHPMNFIPAQTKPEEKKQEKELLRKAKRVQHIKWEPKKGSDGDYKVRPKTTSHSPTDRATTLEDIKTLLDLTLEATREFKPDPLPKPDTLLPRPRPAVVSTQGNTDALESSETLLPSHTRDAPRGST